jgi:hypothetical protein
MPWPDSITRPMTPQAETIPLDHYARADFQKYVFQFSLFNSLLYVVSYLQREKIELLWIGRGRHCHTHFWLYLYSINSMYLQS